MKLSMSEAWREATAMMTGNREVLLILAGLFFFLPSLAVALTMPGFQEAMIANPENAQTAMLSLYTDWWWLMLIVILAQVVGYLSLLSLLRDDSRPTVGQALQSGLTGLLPAIGTYLLFAIGVGLLAGVLMALALASGNGAVGFLIGVILFVGIVYVSVKVSLAGPVIAIDKVYNPLKVLARSWRLTKGNSFRLFLFYLLLAIVYIVVAMVLGIVVGALTLAVGASTGLLINGVLSGLLGATAAVVFIAVIAAVHRQLSGPSAAAVSQTFE
jgi:hypothetical protein